MSKVDHYRAALNAPAHYDMDAKKAFHRTAKKLLKQLAARLDADTFKGYGEHDPIRSNMGGIAVSGEITLHYDRLYVQVSQSVMGSSNAILFRSCTSRKDYTGGSNNFAHMNMLLEPENLAYLIEATVPFSINVSD